MKHLKTLLLFVLLNSFGLSFAQNKFTISGTVKDKKNGEELIGAIIKVNELQNTVASTNEYGFFSLTIPQGKYTISILFLGYQTITQSITLDKNIRLDLAIESSDKQLETVVVTGEKENENLLKPQMGVEKLDVKEINKIPVLMGEKDILKTIQLLPGIKSAGEGNSGFYVRGGGSDQNLILLDEAPVYNASHLLGFFSTFNSDAIKDVTVYKAGMPAQYGGRLSSVLDIKMNEGNNQNYSASGGVGLISSKLNIEGPIQKDKSSFLITGRRTYADLFLGFSNTESIRNSTLYFYDLNAKLNYRISEKDRIFLSGYFGRDVLGFSDVFGFNWGNATGTLRWNHLFTEKLFSNTSLIFSNYDYKIAITSGNNAFEIGSQIRDWNLKQEFQYFPSALHKIRFGFNTIYHTVTPGSIKASSTSSLNNKQAEDRYSLDNSFFINDDYLINEKLSMNYGIRFTTFSVLGKGSFYNFDPDGNVIDTTTYSSGQFIKTYYNFEPRINISYLITTTSSIKASYARNVQNLHLLSNSVTSNPTDVWLPSSLLIKPEVSDQYAVGFYKNFKENKYEFSTEVYYKDMQNQLDYKNGVELNANDKVEGQLVFGKGRAYGIELFIKKKQGKFTGWIGYTLSRTERLINGVNQNNWYPARQDRTHDVSVVGIYELNERWNFSATFVYNTGNAVTFPGGKYSVNGQVFYYYTERNGYRMPDYHRLDVAANYTFKKKGRWESGLSFSIYNLYARENAYSITFRQSETDPTKTEAVQTALFKMIPSISYNFKF